MPVKIPYVDLRGYTPLELLFLYRTRARALVKAAANSYGWASRAASAAVLPLAERASRRWLEKSANPYLGEIARIAEEVGVPGAFTLNLCFEWGCTSGVWRGDDGAVLRRVLDWPFPLLGEHVVVAHQAAEAGEFYNVTWPGYCGVLQGMAPGRFAAALNQAPMRRRGAGKAGDWALGRLGVGHRAALPPAHLLRLAFETAPDYAAAKALLCSTPLAVPAIYILSGRTGEGCVIERTEEAYEARGLANGHVCATNHFKSRLNETGQGWRERPIDSRGRIIHARTLPPAAAGFSWFVPPIANRNSRLAMVANAAARSLSVMGTAGVEPVTEPFHLPA